MITFAKGITSGYAPARRRDGERPDRRAVPRREGTSFLHGLTFAGHPVSCAVALANLDVMEREDLPGRVRQPRRPVPQSASSTLTDLPDRGEVRGMGYFYGIELARHRPDFSDARVRRG